jgi:hypothetical protein
MIKKFIRKIEWLFDYKIVYFLYNQRKIHRYYQYMSDKWDVMPNSCYCSVKESSNENTIRDESSISKPCCAQMQREQTLSCK